MGQWLQRKRMKMLEQLDRTIPHIQDQGMDKKPDTETHFLIKYTVF